MHLNIKNDEAHALASQLASLTGESLTQSVTKALREQLRRLEHRMPDDVETRRQRIEQAAKITSRLPVLDARSAEDMLYDEHGLPK